MLRLSGIQMALKYWIIWLPTSFQPFKYQTSLVIRSPLYKSLSLSFTFGIVNFFIIFTFFQQDGITNSQFLFLLHFCASEIYTSDYTIRSTAGSCIREMVIISRFCGVSEVGWGKFYPILRGRVIHTNKSG